MSNPERIAQVVGKWLGGGVEAVVMNYYRHIDRSKFQFDFICDADSTNIPYEEIEALGGKVIIVPPYQKLSAYLKELKRVFKEGNYKIVHSHINTLSVFPLYAAKKAGVPVRIAHSHATSNKKEWKKNILKNLLRPLSKTFSTDYASCSEVAGRYQFGNKTFNEGKVKLIKNAIEISNFTYSPILRENKRNELGIKNDTFVVGHIGRFVTTKNHSFIIDVFNEIHKSNPNSLLLLAGQGPLMKSIQNKARDSGLSGNVRFLGQQKNVHELYQVFDTVILPSLYEGLGMVLIEAQCAGLPCFCSTGVSPEAKISSNLTYISLEETPEFWAKKILEGSKITRTDTHKEIVANGYDIEEASLEWAAWYEELLKEKY